MEEKLTRFFRKILNTYLKMLASIVIPSIVVVFIVYQYVKPAHHTISTGFHTVLVIYVIANYILTRISFNGRLNELSKVRSLNIRMEEYTEAAGIRWMLWLVVAFLAWISLLISGDFSFLIYIFISVGLYLFWCPTKTRLRKHLRFNDF
ncbi:MAG: hypothetical protein ACOCQ6_00535 [Bacteroidota bacterium]